MKKLLLFFFLFGFLFPCDGFGQENWKVSGQIRHRFEMDNKDFNSDTDANNFNLLRSRIGITFSTAENVEGFIQVQDSRRFTHHFQM